MIDSGEVIRNVSPDLVQKQMLALTVRRERSDANFAEWFQRIMIDWTRLS